MSNAIMHSLDDERAWPTEAATIAEALPDIIEALGEHADYHELDEGQHDITLTLYVGAVWCEGPATDDEECRCGGYDMHDAGMSVLVGGRPVRAQAVLTVWLDGETVAVSVDLERDQ